MNFNQIGLREVRLKELIGSSGFELRMIAYLIKPNFNKNRPLEQSRTSNRC